MGGHVLLARELIQIICLSFLLLLSHFVVHMYFCSGKEKRCGKVESLYNSLN